MCHGHPLTHFIVEPDIIYVTPEEIHKEFGDEPEFPPEEDLETYFDDEEEEDYLDFGADKEYQELRDWLTIFGLLLIAFLTIYIDANYGSTKVSEL